VFAVIIEAQLRLRHGKRLVWPVYLASLRAELDCPVAVLVVCVSRYVARWAASPIALGPANNTIEPLVIGPETPALLDLPFDAPVSPEWAVLRAVALSRPDHALAAALAAVAALLGLDHALAEYYYNLLKRALKRSTRRELEAAMVQTFPKESSILSRFKSQGRKEGLAEGLAEGRAEALLAVLAARGIKVSKKQRALVVGCTDVSTLDTWIRRAASAVSVREVFDGVPP
jgi:hypothetical protein